MDYHKRSTINAPRAGYCMTKEIHIVFQVINALHSLITANSSDKLLLVTLASFAGVRGICPSVRKIAERMGQGYRQTHRNLQRLEDQKLIIIHRSIGKAAQYDFTFLSTTYVASDIGQDADTYVASDIPTYVASDIPPMSHPTYINNKGNNKGNNRERRKERAHTLPDDFMYNKEDAKVAEKLGLKEEHAGDEYDKFLVYYRANGNKAVDWHAMLQSWFMRAAEHLKRHKDKFKGKNY